MVSVSSPAIRAHLKVPQNGNVVIGSSVEIGSNCSIDRATTGSTVIGDHTKLDNLIQVAHNVRIGSGCFIAAQTGIAGSASIGNGVVIGGQVGIAGHISLPMGWWWQQNLVSLKASPRDLRFPATHAGPTVRISESARLQPGFRESWPD